MRYKIMLMLLIIISNINTYAKPKIATSIAPLASLIAMLTNDAAEIVTINVTGGCPHHYHMKPSDKAKIDGAQVLIYIDDDFDFYAAKLAEKFAGKTIKISDFKSLNFRTQGEEINWHFWLDLDNVLALHNELAEIIIKQIPQLKEIIESNRITARMKIQDLISLKNKELAHIKNIVIISDSFEHFFHGVKTNVTRLYQKTNSSLKDYSRIENTLSNQAFQCLIADTNQDDSVYKKFNTQIIKLESENWADSDMGKASLEDLFIRKYLEMILQLKNCTQGV